MVKHDEVLARISHANSLYSVLIDPPMASSHERNNIVEITCLSSMKSVDALNLTFNLIGEECIDNEFVVHRICITCDDVASLKEIINKSMLDHFNRTSNIIVDYMSNSILHDCLYTHANLDMPNNYLPMLG